jgi:hypothetical protein
MGRAKVRRKTLLLRGGFATGIARETSAWDFVGKIRNFATMRHFAKCLAPATQRATVAATTTIGQLTASRSKVAASVRPKNG